MTMTMTRDELKAEAKKYIVLKDKAIYTHEQDLGALFVRYTDGLESLNEATDTWNSVIAEICNELIPRQPGFRTGMAGRTD